VAVGGGIVCIFIGQQPTLAASGIEASPRGAGGVAVLIHLL